MPTPFRFRQTLIALVLALPSVTTVGCTGELTGPGAQEVPSGALRGELVSYVATREDGTSDDYYVLRRGDDELRLVFDTPPDLASGETVDVWGTHENDRLRVRRFELVQPLIEPITQPLVNATAFAP